MQKTRARLGSIVAVAGIAAVHFAIVACDARSDAQTKDGDKKGVSTAAEYKIVSARRSENWGPSNAKYHPPDPKDVVLWVQVKPTPDGWRDGKVPLYVQAGDRRCDHISRSVSTYSSLGEAPPDHAAFVVPRDVLAMTLVVGDQPPKTFKADKEIIDDIDPNNPPK